MSDFRFEKGRGYVGTSTTIPRLQKVFVVSDRWGKVVSFSRVGKVKREAVDDCNGTEIVKLKDDDGGDYFMSARVPCRSISMRRFMSWACARRNFV